MRADAAKRTDCRAIECTLFVITIQESKKIVLRNNEGHIPDHFKLRDKFQEVRLINLAVDKMDGGVNRCISAPLDRGFRIMHGLDSETATHIQGHSIRVAA